MRFLNKNKIILRDKFKSLIKLISSFVAQTASKSPFVSASLAHGLLSAFCPARAIFFVEGFFKKFFAGLWDLIGVVEFHMLDIFVIAWKPHQQMKNSIRTPVKRANTLYKRSKFSCFHPCAAILPS